MKCDGDVMCLARGFQGLGFYVLSAWRHSIIWLNPAGMNREGKCR